jgi:hypothetical protein
MDRLTHGIKLSTLEEGRFYTLEKVIPSGALQARKQTNRAITFYWRYSIGNKSERVTVGLYDPSAPPKSAVRTNKGYSLAGAIRAAEALAIEHHENRSIGGRPALLASRLAKEEAIAKEHSEAKKYTLHNLVNDYADHLEALGRVSHREVRSIFKVHVEIPWPEIAQRIASEVTTELVANMMRRTYSLGKGRTANKLRSYLRAAYQTAKSAITNPRIPERFKAYKITVNPAADTQPDGSQNRADKHPLSVEELRSYWRILKKLQGIRGATLRLHLLTGGQRIAQFVKIKTMESSDEVIKLLDGKGRPGNPARVHFVPLIKEAQTALADCHPKGHFALSTDRGETHIAATTLSKWACEAAAGIKGFRTKRVRSGVETLLSKQGISKEVRGHLQSHGISGIQNRHYDANDFVAEKRHALEMLIRVLESK